MSAADANHARFQDTPMDGRPNPKSIVLSDYFEWAKVGCCCAIVDVSSNSEYCIIVVIKIVSGNAIRIVKKSSQELWFDPCMLTMLMPTHTQEQRLGVL